MLQFKDLNADRVAFQRTCVPRTCFPPSFRSRCLAFLPGLDRPYQPTPS